MSVSTSLGSRLCLVSSILVFGTLNAFAQTRLHGLLEKDGQKLFPIGFYELPQDDTRLEQMAAAGVNLIRCHSRTDLDRVASVGILGVFPLNLQHGATEELRTKVEAVKDHTALAAWEGPDELVENFTDHSSLWKTKGIYDSAQDWWDQTPKAVAYATAQAKKIMPKIHAAVRLVRSLDTRNRAVWLNESNRADVRFVREYVDLIDITGCDIYPIKRHGAPISRVGLAVDRWKQVGRGKPVWMVLQAFSWHELGDYYGHNEVDYPAFKQSRFMAYDVIAHSANGILYWGSHALKSEEFRRSLYALTSELAAIQPLLVAPEVKDVTVRLIEVSEHRDQLGVRLTVRKVEDDWLVILVNNDDHRHMGVEVAGLDELNGRELSLLYGSDVVHVKRGELVTRMQPYEVKVFATGKQWETPRRTGREFGG